MHAVSNGQPIEDDKQDVELISGSEDHLGTTIVFRRKWNTCDSQDFAITVRENTSILL